MDPTIKPWVGLWDYLDGNFWGFWQWAATHLSPDEVGWQPDPAPTIALTDVVAPLVGPEGAAPVFAPQKGATPAHVTHLARGLERLAELFARGLTLSHMDATLKQHREAQRFLGGDIEAELAACGVDAIEGSSRR